MIRDPLHPPLIYTVRGDSDTKGISSDCDVRGGPLITTNFTEVPLKSEFPFTPESAVFPFKPVCQTISICKRGSGQP